MPEAGLVLLAAGQSRRMGSPKQLLELDGVPMLRRAAQAALASLCRPVVIVCGAASDAVGRTVADLPLSVVHNPRWEQGIGTSIHAGISALQKHDVGAAVLALADQPLVTAATFDRLVETWRIGRLPIAASEYDGTLGVPALFDRALFPGLLALPGDQGCKKLILGHPPDLVARCPCPEAGADVDTPEDYTSVNRRLLLPGQTLR